MQQTEARTATIEVALPLEANLVVRLMGLVDLGWPGCKLAEATSEDRVALTIDPDLAAHPGVRAFLPGGEDEAADLSWATTADLLIELRHRLGSVRASAPGNLGSLIEYLLTRGLDADQLAERRAEPRP